MEGQKVSDQAGQGQGEGTNRTLLALLSASIISLLVWAFIIAFDVH